MKKTTKKEAMFADVISLGKERDRKQAIARYIVYFLLGFLIAFILGLILGIVLMGHTLHKIETVAFAMGVIFAGTITLVIGLLMLKSKKKLTAINIIIVLLSAVGGYFVGIWVSFIPLAIISTQKNGEKIDSPKSI